MLKDEMLLNDGMIKKFVDGNGIFYQRVKISDNIEREEETGFLYCYNSILGHVGVQAYNGWEVDMKDQKVVYVRREANDVFDEDSMRSIEGKPVTLHHPDEMVDSKNFQRYAKGFIKNVRREGDNIIGDLVIHDESTIQKVLSGELKDLSLGYQAKLVPVGDGTLKQTDIVVNHLAVVGEGRAENARIVDAKPDNFSEEKGNKFMGLFKKPKVTVEIDFNEEAEPETLQELFDKAEEVKEDIVEDSKEEEIEVADEDKEKDLDEQEAMKSRGILKSRLKEDEDKEETESKEGEKKDMKDFSYFMAKYDEVKKMPKGEFRDKAFETYNAECKETLGVELPTIVDEPKKNILDQSVGLAENTKVEEQPQTRPLVADAQAEERWFKDLYRSMDKKENAQKYASMSYHDVIDMLEGRRK
ncbi:MAG: DUF2213 domain-containing protein [Fermentimonas sp.]